MDAIGNAATAGSLAGFLVATPVIFSPVKPGDEILPIVAICFSPVLGGVGGMLGGVVCLLCQKQEAALLFGASGGSIMTLPFVWEWSKNIVPNTKPSRRASERRRIR